MASLPNKVEEFNADTHPFKVLLGTVVMLIGVFLPPARRLVAWLFRRMHRFALALANPFTAPARIELQLAEHAAAFTRNQELQDRRHRENQEWLQAVTAEVEINTQWTRDSANETFTFQADGKGNWIWTSNALCQLTQIAYTELLASGWRLMVVNADRERIAREWDRCIRESQPILESFGMRIGSSGKVVQVEMYARPVRCRRGDVAAFLGKIRKTETP